MEAEFNKEERLHQLFERIEHSVEIHQYDRAHDLLGDAFKDFPNDTRVHSLLAYTHLNAEKYPDAEAAAQDALALEPSNTWALRLLALAVMNQGRNQDAEKHLLTGLRIDPSDSYLLTAYARLMLRVNQYEKAEKLARRALEEEPDSADAHSVLSMIQSARLRTREAGVSADAALALDPDSEGTHAVAGAQALIAGRVFKARNHLREALRQDPGDDDVAELFLEADRSARPPGLLFYYWSWVVHRVPGGRFGIWGAFVAFLAMHKSLGVPPLVATCVIFGYLGICLYTWIASPLTALWIRVFPTKY